MKVFLFWVVAAWVMAVTADRPCAEYCAYLWSGTHDIEFLPDCDCMYDDEYQKRTDDTNFYYEALNYAPLPVYFRNQPFHIVNHIIPEHTSKNNPEKLNTVSSSLQSRSHDNMELNVENTHSTYSRHEKDTQSNEKRLNAPVYLDVSVELKDLERSASTKFVTSEELHLTEQRLLECTNLHTVLHYRKHSEMKDKVNIYLLDRYINLSNEELDKIIRNKCSHIAYIIEESLNEIQKTRSKLTSVMFRTAGDDQLNNKRSHNDNNHITTEKTPCTSVTENNLQSSVQSKSDTQKYNEHQEEVTVNYTESDAKTPDSHNSSSNNQNTTPKNPKTLSAEIASTNTATTSIAEIQNSSDAYITTLHVSTEVSKASTETLTTTPMPAQSETTSLHTITLTSEASTFVENILAETSTTQEVVKETRTDEVEAAATPAINGRPENRPHYEEWEVPLVKIITHEYSNDTVQSFLNGTEDIPNGDFSDELTPPEILQSTPSSAAFETAPISKGDEDTASDITGQLYFYFNTQHIPAKFVQNSNGSIHLGVDGVKLCDTLTQNDNNKFSLLINLCNCYKTGNCGQNNTN